MPSPVRPRPTSTRPRRLRLEPLEAREVPATVTAADDIDDYDPASPGDWDGPNDELSLREAIRQVNTEFGGAIEFAVDTVTLAAPLEPITQVVTITGRSNGGAPGTVIDGAGTTGGLTLTAGGTVRGLVIQEFSGYGMSIAGTADVQNCFFGTIADGSAAAANTATGLIINSGTVKDSLFAANGGVGLQVTGTAVVENNKFGTDVSGSRPLANAAGGVILTGPASVVRNNLVSGNGGAGVRVEGTAAVGNKVVGNKIGIGADGSLAVPNAVGVVVTNLARGTIVGGTAAGDGNVIAGNTGDGVSLDRAGPGTKVLGNWIGVAGPAGTQAVPNGANGVLVRSTAGAVVGGTAAGSRNLIAGNTGAGVRLEGAVGVTPATRANRVEGNWVGLDAAEAVAGNAGGGVVIAGPAAANRVGGTVVAARNVISGNGTAGVVLTGAGTTGNLVLGNYIGTNAAGTEARPNLYGVEIFGGAFANAVGGGAVGARNLISGNTRAGVYLHDAPTRVNRVLGNFIGTTPDGAAALGNGEAGVRIDGAVRTVIGGATVGARNLISGNGGDGVSVAGAAGQDQQNVIIGNYVGVDVTGAAALGNQAAGVSVAGGKNNRVGGVTVGERNTISGHTFSPGVHVQAGAAGTRVVNNHIGTDAKGKAPIPNQVGVLVGAGTANTTIGGLVRSQGNVIAGNTSDGVRLEAAARVRNNLIGTDRTAKLDLGNLGNGVAAYAAGSLIGGGAALANVIAFNHQNGVLVSGGSANTITGNRIFYNWFLPISLANGGNNSIQTPDIHDVSAGGVITITAQVFQVPNATIRVELFASDRASGFWGEGKLFLGAIVGTKSDPNGIFTVTFRRTVPPTHRFLSITVTDAQGNTTQFSEAVYIP